MFGKSESYILNIDDLLTGINISEEPQPNIAEIKSLPFDLTLRVHTDNGYKFIETHKAILVMYSEVFRKSIIDKFKEFEHEVSDVEIMKKFINSLYDGNIAETIKNTKSCREKMELLRLCIYYAVDIPIAKFFMEEEVDKECEKEFLNTLHAFTATDQAWQEYIYDIKINKIINSLYTNEFYLLALVMNDGNVNFLNFTNNRLMSFHLAGKYHKAEYSRDRQRLILYESNFEGPDEIWNMNKYPPKIEYRKRFARHLQADFISPDGTYLVFMEDKRFTVIDIITEKVIMEEISENILLYVTISPSNKYIAYCSALTTLECQIFILNLGSVDNSRVDFFAIQSNVNHMAFTTDDFLLMLTESNDLSVRNILQKTTEDHDEDTYFAMWITMNQVILINFDGEIFNLDFPGDTSSNKTFIKIDKNFSQYLEEEIISCSDFHFAVKLDKTLDIYYLKNSLQILRIDDPEGNISHLTL